MRDTDTNKGDTQVLFVKQNYRNVHNSTQLQHKTFLPESPGRKHETSQLYRTDTSDHPYTSDTTVTPVSPARYTATSEALRGREARRQVGGPEEGSGGTDEAADRSGPTDGDGATRRDSAH